MLVLNFHWGVEDCHNYADIQQSTKTQINTLYKIYDINLINTISIKLC